MQFLLSFFFFKKKKQNNFSIYKRYKREYVLGHDIASIPRELKGEGEMRNLRYQCLEGKGLENLKHLNEGLYVTSHLVTTTQELSPLRVDMLHNEGIGT